MNTATLIFTEHDNEDLEMKIVFSGDNFNASLVSHLAAAKAAEMINKLLDEAYKVEDEPTK